MCVRPARNRPKDEATRQDGISRIRKGLFDAEERNVEVISEQVEAEEDGWEVGREEAGEENSDRVIVMRCQ